MPMPDPGWSRIETEDHFRKLLVGREISGSGMTFTIRADGRIFGQIDGKRLVGSWIWRDGLFCRKAALDGVDLGEDCETIEVRGPLMRYTRDAGAGEASIVTVT